METLYHFTSQSALLSIVQNGCIWASHPDFLNDGAERSYYANLLKEDVINRFESKKRNDLASLFKKAIDSDPTILTDVGAPYYVFSLSKNYTSASQWDRYAENGNGVCIGFNKDELIAAADDNANVKIMEHGEIQYGKTNVCANIENHSLVHVENYTGNEMSAEKLVSSMLGMFRVTLMENGLLFKHQSFSDEQEYRLTFAILQEGNILPTILYPSHHEYRYRVSKTGIVPYCQYSWASERRTRIISRIVIGPKAHRNIKYSIAHLLVRHGYAEDTKAASCMIEQSDTPLI